MQETDKAAVTGSGEAPSVIEGPCKCPTCKERKLRKYSDGWWRCDDCNKVTDSGKAPSERAMMREITELLISLKSDICDDYRASDDIDDDTPGMQVTVSTNDMQSWNYQTGDNSFSGGCYGDANWSVIYLYRRSNCKELAKDAVNELADAVAENEEISTGYYGR